jgi:hypothetical protein
LHWNGAMQQVNVQGLTVVGLHAAFLLRFGRQLKQPWRYPLAVERPPVPAYQDASRAVGCQHALIQVNQDRKTGDTAPAGRGRGAASRIAAEAGQ